MSIDFEGIKRAAEGRWGELLAQLTPLPAEVLTRRSEDHPCPQCNGRSVIWPASDALQTGSIACRKCTDNRPTGDGIATIARWSGLSMGEAARAVASHLGVDGGTAGNAKPEPEDIITAVARAKRMPLSGFLLLGPVPAERGRGKAPVARTPVYNELLEEHSYFDFLPDAKGFFRRGPGMSGLFLRKDWRPNPGDTVLMVEGGKDCATLLSLGFNAVGMPSSCLSEKYCEVFRGVHVVLVPDLDQAGQAGAQRSGGRLKGIAASVRVARLPGEIVERGGDDVRDVLRRPDGERLVREAIDNAAPWQPRDGELDHEDGRPEALVTLAYGHTCDQVVRNLGQLGWSSDWIPASKRERLRLFQRGGVLVHLVTEIDPEATAGGVRIPTGTTRIRPLPIGQLPLRIADACQLIQEKEVSGEIERQAVPPPRWLIDGIHSRGEYGREVRPLAGVVTGPTLRADGSILQAPGYDEQTGLVYCPSAKFGTVPDKPTERDAQKAADDVLEVVKEFPFVSGADRSAWLALLLSLVGRPAVSGPVPLFAATANVRGSGKSLLADAASVVAFGRPAARTTYTRDDTEMRKSITATALEAHPSVLFDNVEGAIGGAALDAALTGVSWSDRILGSSRTTGELPLRTVWTCSGNNLMFSADAARRVLPIRLESPLERPEDRTDLERPDLLGWIREHRPRLTVAALTLLRAYFVAGCPPQAGGTWGSYESWTMVIRGAICWAGLADPLETREEARGSDESAEQLRMLIAGLQEIDHDGEGVTAKEIENAVTSRPDESPTCPVLREAVSMLCGNRINARSIGRFLTARRRRIIGGLQIVDLPGRAGIKRWTVQEVGESGCYGGDGGFENTQSLAHVSCVSSTRTGARDTTHTYGSRGDGNPPNQSNPPGNGKARVEI